MEITKDDMEFVSKANGYCKKMNYEKGNTKYNIAWLAYMAAISSIPTVQLDALLCEISGIFDGWHSDGTYWTEYDEGVRKRIDEFRKKYTYIKHLNMSTHEQRLKELDEMQLPTDADFKIDIEPTDPLTAGKPTKSEKAIRWLENLPVPEGGGLLQRLADNDKALSEFYDLQDPFRRGFMLAEEIVKKWCEENYPLGK